MGPAGRTAHVPAIWAASGWGSLALRGNKGDLIGCGNDPSGTHAIYSINVSVNSRVASLGQTTLMFNAQSREDICDGVSWDASDNTVWMSPDVDVLLLAPHATTQAPTAKAIQGLFRFASRILTEELPEQLARWRQVDTRHLETRNHHIA